MTVTRLRYQSYLNDTFHTTWPARLGHAVCNPLVTTLLVAALPSP